MELWIRSQDKTKLIEAELISIDQNDKNKKYEILCGLVRIGTYKTKERALEIIDEIGEKIMLLNTINLTKNQEMLIAFKRAMGEDKIKGLAYPYQMPKE